MNDERHFPTNHHTNIHQFPFPIFAVTANMKLPPLLYFRDDFRMTTWLLIGASLQAALLFLPIRLAIAPTVLILIARVTSFLLVRQGILPGREAYLAPLGKTTAQLPRADGSFSSQPSDQGIVVFILAARSNQ